MHITRKLAVALAGLMLALVAIEASSACPFCQAGSGLTLTEQSATSDAVVLVQWVNGKEADDQTNGSTNYEIIDALKQPERNARERRLNAGQPARDPSDRVLAPVIDADAVGSKKPSLNDKPVVLKKGERLTLDRYRAAKPGDLFLLMGTLPNSGNGIDWQAPEAITEAGYQYVKQAPSPEAEPIDRLRYFLKFLEFPDDLVSGDAYREFAKAPYEQLVPLAKSLHREKIRHWLTNPETPQVRLGLYGLMLGLCGDADDAKLMAEKINDKSAGDDIRLGIDGVMAGYLLLTGAKGLDDIDANKLKASHVPASEIFSTMTALRFLWSYSDGVVAKDRIVASMRLVLDHPELAEFCIPDLARWGDWSVQDRLAKIYGTGEYDVPAIKTAIVLYMLASTKYKAKGDEPVPERVAKGKQYLQVLREKDPKTVKTAERFAN